MMVKSGLDFFILKFTEPLQRYLLTCQTNSAFLSRFFCTGQPCFEEKRGGLTYQIPLNQALGFPRNANYQEVENSLKNLLDITLADTMPDKRIEIHPRGSSCVIQ